jgi:DNA-binding SARP family transcriptional activator
MQNRHTGTAVQPHLSVSSLDEPAPGTGDADDAVPATGGTHGSDRAILLGLLGPLLLIRGGRQVTPSAPKLRLVLSLLAVQANSVTRVDQLVEELWGESPPPSALTTVQTYIYQLRKLLKLDDQPTTPPGDDSPARPALLSHPGGYILQLPDLADVDANLFEQLARRGRAELLGAHSEAAAETFRDALALWRGNVLEGVPTGPVLYAHATRLEELRRTVVTLRIEADLQLGRHHELIGELGSMIAAEPTREDICAKLMIALYRSGRRVDALSVYQRMRTVLIDELGLDPAADLQRLHQLMLEANPELDLPTRPVAPPPVPAALAVAAPPAPAQLPADIPDFVGRSAELTALTGLLSGDETVRVVNVVGRPGTGKNTLVVRATREVRGNFPDGQLYVDLLDADGRPTPTRQLLAGMLRALGAPEEDVPANLGEAALLFRSWTADRRLLVVLNKASDELLPHHLFPTGTGCAVVVISRAPIAALSGAVRLRVPALSTAEAVELLASMTGESRVAVERAAAVELVELADRLPLAVRAVGARLAARPGWHLARLVERMRDEHHRLSELSYGGFDVLDRFADAFQTLNAQQRWVLRRMAAADGEPLTVAEIAKRVSMSVAVVHDTLDELVDADLVEELDTREEDPRHQVPELVRLVGLSGLVGSTWWRRRSV